MRFTARLLSASIVATVVALPLCGSAAHASDDATPRSGIVAVSSIRIGNFGQVSPTYYRGEQPDGRDYADLAALGIKTVIDLQADGDNHDEPRSVEAAGMRFHRIPMTTRVAPTPGQLAQFMAIVNDPAQQPVYVHCAGGKHRTGVMTAVFRMEQDGWTAEQAFKEMKRYKFGWDLLHPEFKRFVYGYETGKLALVRGLEPANATD